MQKIFKLQYLFLLFITLFIIKHLVFFPYKKSELIDFYKIFSLAKSGQKNVPINAVVNNKNITYLCEFGPYYGFGSHINDHIIHPFINDKNFYIYLDKQMFFPMYEFDSGIVLLDKYKNILGYEKFSTNNALFSNGITWGTWSKRDNLNYIKNNCWPINNLVLDMDYISIYSLSLSISENILTN